MIEEKMQEYTCSRCIDHKNKVEPIKEFVALHMMRIPPEVFEYMYLETQNQWVILNKCQRSQCVENLRQLLFGARHIQYDIDDL